MRDHFVYIIFSATTQRFYTGMTSLPNDRLFFHNKGLNTSTKSGVPWTLVWVSSGLAKKDATILEKKIKKRGAKRYLEDLSKNI